MSGTSAIQHEWSTMLVISTLGLGGFALGLAVNPEDAILVPGFLAMLVILMVSLINVVFDDE